MNLTAALDKAVKAVCPITGVSIGDTADKLTWRFNPLPSATPSEISAAQGVIDAFDLAAHAQQEADELAKAASLDSAIATDPTLAAFKAMDNAQFDAWWAANVTNAAQAIGVLKRLAKIVIRRL